MVAFPPCKINLGLNIVEKREDGFHTIDTCFYPVPWTDILEILPSRKLTITLTGIPIPGIPEDNICLKAYHVLSNDFELPPVHIHLHKIVPIGAGLGGGSADGAYTLKILNMLFELRLTNEQLKAYASTLGSDCAFFIEDIPSLGTEKGDVLAPIKIDLSGKYLVIIKPEIHVSTAEAYAGVTPNAQAISVKEIIETLPIEQWQQLENDFEKSVFKKYPEIEALKKSLYNAGAVYASMSGSGSSVYGIFDAEIDSGTFTSGKTWSGWL